MRIGDEVRFLNEVGGGKIVGFKNKSIALVQISDGFEIPVLINELVVVASDKYDRNTTANKHTGTISPQPIPTKPEKNPPLQPAAGNSLQERRDGDRLNVFLAFVPTNPDSLVDTSFDTYIVNDSNYFITLTYLSAEGAAWKARFEGTLEPNTKFFIEEVERAQLDEISRISLQMLVYKREKLFTLKPALSVERRIDGSKFYKAGAFKSNVFFSEPALVYDIIVDDEPVRGIFIDAGEIRDALIKKSTHVPPTTSSKPDVPHNNNIIEIDLHANAFFDSVDGLSATDIMNRQLAEVREIMKKYKRHKGQRIVFIHGKGDGVLRAAVLKELKRHYPACRTQDASFREYGFGATLVTVG